jgi:hypothetical protein
MKPRLQWPKHPSRSRHRILGLRLRLTDRSKRYRIERFPDDGDPVFIVVFNDGAWRVMSHHRKLKAAKLFCQTHYRQTERNTRVRRG